MDPKQFHIKDNHAIADRLVRDSKDDLIRTIDSMHLMVHTEGGDPSSKDIQAYIELLQEKNMNLIKREAIQEEYAINLDNLYDN